MRLEPPLLVETSRILASSLKDQKQIVLITKRRGQDIKVTASLDLKDVIEKIAGPLDDKGDEPPKALDLGYGDVVAFIDVAHRTEALEARVILQPLEILVPGGTRPVVPPTGETEVKAAEAADQEQ